MGDIMNAFKYGVFDWVVPYVLLIGLAVVDIIGVIMLVYYWSN